MKKTFKFMMMALAAIVMSVSFAACSSSDDDNNTPGTPENPGTPSESKESYLEIKVQLSDDLLSVADVTVEYTAEDGTIKTESITQKDFEKKVVYKNEPSTIQSNVKFTLKENYPAKDTYELTCSNRGTGVQLKTGGNIGGNSYSYKAKADKLPDYIKQLNSLMKWSK